MEPKELKVQVPEGYEIDKENSTFECVKFKPKSITYDNIIDPFTCSVTDQRIKEKLLAVAKLMNVAGYLNGDWVPDNYNQKYYIYYSSNIKDICIGCHVYTLSEVVYFKSKEAVEQAINILGKDTIKSIFFN